MRDKILLHICCAPDATYPFLELSRAYEVIGYFYGSNIQPEEEYIKRLEAIKKLSKEWNLKVLVDEYNPISWFEEIKGLENEPEGGKRCERCFYVQLKRAAETAKSERVKTFTTTLTISPHKDVKLINQIGKEIDKEIGIAFLERVFRKNEGFKKSIELSRNLNLYRQSYCGCIFSLRKEERLKWS
ncbi:MAG: epoxyqueuosine reductase QueH [Synergistetes bacterium]|nr:epoxyqueuosine reductase QueH [Synergistota bacterium]MCX8127877.1 epoxyqueuosine reductase QueH [Synergistota bacterium]MDW8192139.1 epoxyqueuosine reductase QueH [Synergistota bacterium]